MLQRESVFGSQTPALRYVSTGKPRGPISHIALCTTRAKNFLGCLWLRGHCCLAGVLLSLKPTPNGFSFGEKADWA